MKIKSKLYVVTLVPLILLSAVISFSSISKIKSSLKERNFNTLQTARDIKKDQLEHMFENLRSNIEVISKTQSVKSFVLEFLNLDDYEDLVIDPNGKFPIEDENIIKMSEKKDEYFQMILGSYNIADLYLVSIQDGHIVYSAAKNVDYGENLNHGVLENSNLANLYKKVKESKKTTFSDMQYYDLLKYPVMFLATPVMIDEIMESILVFQLNLDSINDIMNFRKGYGETQEDYLVGGDSKLRSDTFIDKNSFNINSDNIINTTSVTNSQDGKIGVDMIQNYKDDTVLSAYLPIKIEDDIRWSLISEISKDEIDILPDTIQLEILSLAFFILIIITLSISYITNKTLIRPIEKLKGTVKGLSKFSSADQKINIDSKDEIGELASYFNHYLQHQRDKKVQEQQIVEECEKAIAMIRGGFFEYKVTSTSKNRTTNDLKDGINLLVDDLKEKFTKIKIALLEYGKGNFEYQLVLNNTSGTIGSIATATKALGDNSSELLATIMQSGSFLQSNISNLSQSSVQLSNSSTQQASFLEETAASVDNISQTIKENTKRVIKLKDIDEKLVHSAVDGQKLANDTAVSMDEITQEITSISQAITIIDQIAFQTNILSLNAAVEAATAGESGKGFAVVAQEVRNLASRSAEAANEIKKLVDSANSKASQGQKIASDMLTGYKALELNINETQTIIDEVANSSYEQEKSIIQINEAVGSLDTNTQKNASEALNIENLSKEVDILSNNLISIASNATFKSDALMQICDKELMKTINDLKLELISFKDNSFENLHNGVKNVTCQNSCHFSKWIGDMENSGEVFISSDTWLHIKQLHKKLHDDMKEYVVNNDKNSDEGLILLGNNIEDTIQTLFKELDKIKILKCKG